MKITYALIGQEISLSARYGTDVTSGVLGSKDSGHAMACKHEIEWVISFYGQDQVKTSESFTYLTK